jgi:hypothetical protein
MVENKLYAKMLVCLCHHVTVAIIIFFFLKKKKLWLTYKINELSSSFHFST